MLNAKNTLVVMALFCSAFVSGTAFAGGTHFVVEPFSGVTFNQGFDKENAILRSLP